VIELITSKGNTLTRSDGLNWNVHLAKGYFYMYHNDTSHSFCIFCFFLINEVEGKGKTF